MNMPKSKIESDILIMRKSLQPYLPGWAPFRFNKFISNETDLFNSIITKSTGTAKAGIMIRHFLHSIINNSIYKQFQFLFFSKSTLSNN